MTIRLACATSGTSSVIARRLCAPASLSAFNDNGQEAVDDRMVWEALRHFARHGLRAALQAADSAEAALDAGDREGFEWWQAICHKLDRQMGEALARRAAIVA